MSFDWLDDNLSFLSDEEKAEYKYEAGPKNFSALGFVRQSAIQRQWLIGDGCMVFQAQDGDEVRIDRHYSAYLCLFFLVTAFASGFVGLGIRHERYKQRGRRAKGVPSEFHAENGRFGPRIPTGRGRKRPPGKRVMMTCSWDVKN